MGSPREAVTVIGLGYAGLATAACLASGPFSVTGVDIDSGKVRALRRGRVESHEKGLEEMVRRGIKRGNLRFTHDKGETIDKSGIVFIAVGTPSKRDGSIDLSQIKSASKSVARSLAKSKKYKLIVIKSTVVPKTTEGIIIPLIEKHSGRSLGEFGLAVNPEFLREGSAVQDTLHPDRIVIGTEDQKSGRRLEALYRGFYGSGMPEVILTNTVNAEMIKYASNAFLATKVGFVNEIANLCSSVPGADVSVVARGMGLDRRIDPHFLRAGLGWGGSCLPKDVRALLAAAKASHTDLPIIEAVYEQNLDQPLIAVRLARKLLGSLGERRIALLGLAFKQGTDDMRGAVSIRLVKELLKEGAEVVAFDPAAIQNARKIFGGTIEYASSVGSCLEGADCAIVVTEWNEFRRVKPRDFRVMRNRALVDGRRVFSPAQFEKEMKFEAVGRSKPKEGA